MSFFLEVKAGPFWVRTVYEYSSQKVAIEQLKKIREDSPKQEFRMVMVTHDECVMDW